MESFRMKEAMGGRIWKSIRELHKRRSKELEGCACAPNARMPAVQILRRSGGTKQVNARPGQEAWNDEGARHPGMSFYLYFEVT